MGLKVLLKLHSVNSGFVSEVRTHSFNLASIDDFSIICHSMITAFGEPTIRIVNRSVDGTPASRCRKASFGNVGLGQVGRIHEYQTPCPIESNHSRGDERSSVIDCQIDIEKYDLTHCTIDQEITDCPERTSGEGTDFPSAHIGLAFTHGP